MEVLTKGVDMWEKAASDVDTILPHLPETDREHWREWAKKHLARAKRYESMIERAKEDDRG
jgi:hypothetical protein